jgi:hypothetical protein
LDVAHTLVNEGTISSAANLNIIAGNRNLLINNIGGTLAAPNGVISIQAPGAGAHDTVNLTGGTLQSQAVNVDVAHATVNITPERMNGVININAGNAHVGTTSGGLTLGQTNITDDPTFWSLSGPITITAPGIPSGESVAILSGGDVIFAPVGTGQSCRCNPMSAPVCPDTASTSWLERS